MHLLLSVSTALFVMADCSASAPDPKTVTFESPGERVSVLLKEMSPLFGKTLVATKSTQDDVVAVRLQSVSQKEALDRLAGALHASWEVSGGRWHLVRTPKQDREQLAADRLIEVEEIREAQANVANEIAKSGPFSVDAANSLADALEAHIKRMHPGGDSIDVFREGNALQARGPIYRCMTQLRLTIPAEQLQDIPPGMRVVYSNLPTKLQRQLPAAAAAFLEQAAKDQQIWAVVASKRTFDAPAGVFVGQLAQFRHPLPATPSRVLLGVTRLNRETELTFDLALLDDQNNAMVRTSIGSFFGNHLAARRAPAATDSPLGISDDVRGYADLLNSTRRGKTEISEPWRMRLLDPEKFEPLGLALGPALIAVSKAKGENLLAVLDDRIWPLSGTLAGTRSHTVEGFLNNLSVKTHIEEANHWITVKPLTPAIDRLANVDRGLLKAYLADVVKSGHLSLEQSAAWATQVPLSADNTMPGALASILLPSTTDFQSNEHLLRLYGAMSSAQRLAAASQNGVTIGSLNPLGSEELNKLLFGFGMSLRVDMAVGPAGRPQFAGMVPSEPTELLAPLSLASAPLHLSESTGTAVFAASGLGSQRPLNARQLAMRMSMSARGGFGEPAPTQFLVGRSRQVTFTVDFSDTVHLGPLELTDILELNPQPVAYADLPADFRAQVDKESERMKRFQRGPVRVVPPF